MGGRGTSSASGGSRSTAPSSAVRSALDAWSDDSLEFREATAYSNADPDSDAGLLDDWAADGSYGGDLYRGIQVDDWVLEDLRNGVNSTIDQTGLSSWSENAGVAQDFAENGYYGDNSVIFVMRGGTSMGQQISDYSNYPHEREVLVSSKSLQRITGVRESDGITYIEVKEVRR